MILRSLALFAATLPLVLGDVKFTSPAAGATLTGGGTISVEWSDSGTAPAVTDLSSYQLFLCAGGNDASNFIQLAPIVTTGQFATGNAASGTITASIGGSVKNAYFLKMISVATAGGTVTNYSPRFSLSGMTGTFPANVQSGLSTVSGTSGPATENNVQKANQNPGAGAGAGAGAQGGEFTVPYTLQTGLTKYAPMAPQPPTKITRGGKPTAQWPTSAVVYAQTRLPTPSVVTTFTASQTFSVQSIENTAAAAAAPTDAMQRFLNRWRD